MPLTISCRRLDQCRPDPPGYFLPIQILLEATPDILTPDLKVVKLNIPPFTLLLDRLLCLIEMKLLRLHQAFRCQAPL